MQLAFNVDLPDRFVGSELLHDRCFLWARIIALLDRSLIVISGLWGASAHTTVLNIQGPDSSRFVSGLWDANRSSVSFNTKARASLLEMFDCEDNFRSSENCI